MKNIPLLALLCALSFSPAVAQDEFEDSDDCTTILENIEDAEEACYVDRVQSYCKSLNKLEEKSDDLNCKSKGRKVSSSSNSQAGCRELVQNYNLTNQACTMGNDAACVQLDLYYKSAGLIGCQLPSHSNGAAMSPTPRTSPSPSPAFTPRPTSTPRPMPTPLPQRDVPYQSPNAGYGVSSGLTPSNPSSTTISKKSGNSMPGWGVPIDHKGDACVIRTGEDTKHWGNNNENITHQVYFKNNCNSELTIRTTNDRGETATWYIKPGKTETAVCNYYGKTGSGCKSIVDWTISSK